MLSISFLALFYHFLTRRSPKSIFQSGSNSLNAALGEIIARRPALLGFYCRHVCLLVFRLVGPSSVDRIFGHGMLHCSY